MTKFNLFAMAAAGLVLAGCSSTPTEEGTKTTAAPATPVVGAACFIHPPIIAQTEEIKLALHIFNHRHTLRHVNRHFKNLTDF